MKKNYNDLNQLIMSLFLLLLTFNSFGQNLTIDSLLTLVKSQSHESKIETLNELAWEFRKINTEKATQYALDAKNNSLKISFEEGFITSLNRLGVIAIYQKNIDKAEEIYLDLIKKEKERKNSYGVARAHNQLGLIYTEKGNFKKSLVHSLKAEEEFESLNKKTIVGITSNNIGDLYRRLGRYDKAMEYLLKSLHIKQESRNKEAVALTLQNIGIFQTELKNYSKAIEYLQKCQIAFKEIGDNYELAKTYKNLGRVYFETHDYELSQQFYNKCLKLKEELELTEKDPTLFNNLGTLYHQKKDFKNGLLNYYKGLEIKKTSTLYYNIASLYFLQKKHKKALEYYQKALIEVNKKNEPFEKLDILKGISDSYSKLKKYSLALKHNASYLQVRDSLEKNYKKALILKVNYEEEQKKIELQSKENELLLEKRNSENKKKSIIIYSLLIGLILLSLLFFAIIRGNKQKQLAKLSEKNRQIEAQKVTELLKKQELKSMNAMMLGQEEERKRISRDLHDRLGSMLAMVKNHFKSVEIDIDKLKTANINLYQKANSLLDEACEEVRKISQDMSSGVLTKFGLTAAIEDLKNILEESQQLEVEFVSHGLQERLHLNLEITVYRIIQELMSNILKHSKATEISIQLLKSKNTFNVIVEDNGIGFNPSQINMGMGLENITSRVKGLYGDIQIDSQINKGTTTTIDIPIKNKE